MTVGIVAVSHSAALAQAARELALQMVADNPPAFALAAGTPDGGLGTDATAVAAAITEVASPDGVLVFMDLGSAVLSAEMALEFIDLPDVEVRLTSAPFVEGLLAATVRAAGGASLDQVAHEAGQALLAKRAQVGDVEASAAAPVSPRPAAPASAPPPTASATASATATRPGAATPGTSTVGSTASRGGGIATEAAPVAAVASTAQETVVRNPVGLHARPAAVLAGLAAGFDASITVADVTRDSGPVQADSSILLMSLGAKQGDTVRVDAIGPDADEAVAAIVALFEDGFGEL